MTILFISLIVAFFLLVVFTPNYNYEKINLGVFTNGYNEGGSEVLYFKDGLYGAVLVNAEDPTTKVNLSVGTFTLPYNTTFFGKDIKLRINGKVQCGTGKHDMRTTTLLGVTPIFLHDDPKTALNIGLGCGLTLGVLEQYPLEKIISIELDPLVVEAAAEFKDVHGSAMEDARAEIIVADARNWLISTDKTFDIIVNEPPDPWVTSSTYLFSVESFEILRDHLNEGGIVSQWVPIYELSVEDFKIMYKTFSEVFPYTQAFISKTEVPDEIGVDKDYLVVNTWKNDFTEVILLGSMEPIPINENKMNGRILHFSEWFEKVQIVNLREFYLFDGAQMEGYVGDVPINTDDHPIIEFSTARLRYDNKKQEVIESIVDYAWRKIG